MKVLHLIESLEFGGAEKVVVHLANKMNEQHEVQVCTTKRRGELENEIDPQIKVTHLELGEGNKPGLPLAIRKLLTDNNIEILHIHDWGVYVEGVIATLGTSTCVIQTVHGPYIQYAAGVIPGLKKRLRHIVEKLLSHRVEKIISVSEDIRNYIIRDIGIAPARVATIHNGIADIGKDRQSGQDCTDGVAFITAGRLAPIKNHRMMLEAFQLAYQENGNITLTIVGDGGELENLRLDCKNLGIENAVSFTGFRTDVQQLLENHDVFLLSSRYEGISIALLEAMSLALPAITTDVGGLSEMVEHGRSGYVVADNQAELFAEAMKKFTFERNLIREFGRNARRHYLAEFNEEAVVAKYNALYNGCFAHG